ncbi:MAG: Shikimate dehydrogenase [Acidimicrobiaceae bacterium]|jgi:shikimate dehydrogenase|nr:Shikimate dehydrogenase [Acidimicrobiaceae bacterium]
MARPTGRTAVVGIIGDPVEHSLSPALHNAAFAHLGADWVYVAFPVAPRDVAAAIAGAKALGVRGLSVTMPHKQAAALASDQRTPAVELLGAANTIVVRSGVALAHSTDGAGLLADLADGPRFDPAGRDCVVLGAGGAARAVVLALAEAGARSVTIVNRTPARAESAAALAGAAGRVGSLDDLAGADLVVKATPLGMAAHTDLAAGAGDDAGIGERMRPGQLAVDLVYAPTTTPFLADAAAAGAATRNGLGMLVRQAVLQFELWTGEAAPLETMWAAAREGAGGSGR